MRRLLSIVGILRDDFCGINAHGELRVCGGARLEAVEHGLNQVLDLVHGRRVQEKHDCLDPAVGDVLDVFHDSDEAVDAFQGAAGVALLPRNRGADDEGLWIAALILVLVLFVGKGGGGN